MRTIDSTLRLEFGIGAQERAVKERDVLGVWFRRIDGTVLRQRC